MGEIVAIKGYVKRELRRQAFAQFALHDLTFSAWLQGQLERWVREMDQAKGSPLAQNPTYPGRDNGELAP